MCHGTPCGGPGSDERVGHAGRAVGGSPGSASVTGMTRWGILATGDIASRFAEDLRLVPGAELAAVGSRAAESAQRFADTVRRRRAPTAPGRSWPPTPRWTSIYVATPHAAHHEAAMICLEAGQGGAVGEAVHPRPGHQRRAGGDRPRRRGLPDGGHVDAAEPGDPAGRPSWSRTGAIGKVTDVQADFGVAGPFPPEHRLRDPALGGGALLDLGVYPITPGPPAPRRARRRVRSWAQLDPGGRRTRTPASLLGYAGGAVAALTCGIVGDEPAPPPRSPAPRAGSTCRRRSSGRGS